MPSTPSQKLISGILIVSSATALYGCAMSEEMRRIEERKQAELRQEASRSTNLTGEQLFIRSCNSCHPSGKAGMGPSLEKLNERFPDDASLKKLIRTGKGIMPAQPKSVITDSELESLIEYLRRLKS